MNNGHESSLVSLNIPKEISQPIVAAKIQEAVLAALGGADKIIETLIHKICNTMVNPADGKTSGYSNDNKMSWIDYQVTNIIESAVKAEVNKQLAEGALPVKEALIKVMQSKSGSNKIAEAILEGLTGKMAKEGMDFKVDFSFKAKQTSRW